VEPEARGAIATMLFFAALNNNADKSVLDLAAVPIMRELRLSRREFGFLGSSFFLLYPFSAIFVSFLATWIHARWLLLGLVVFWVAGTISYDWLGRIFDISCVPHFAQRGGRSGVSSDGPRALQMVS
jgi:hypothetical protein